MQPRKNQTLIIIGVIVVLGLFGLGLLANRKQPAQHSAPTETSQTELTSAVIIDNTDKLSSILLPEQYAATQDTLSSYIHTHIDKNIDHATITTTPKVADDGTVSFKIKTDNPTREFTVQIGRKKFDSITVTVPETSYSQVVKVYGQGQD